MEYRNDAGLKIPRRKACRFESGPGHHIQSRTIERRAAFLFFCGPRALAKSTDYKPLPKVWPFGIALGVLCFLTNHMSPRDCIENTATQTMA